MKCKVAFTTLDEKTGVEKETFTNMLVQAPDLRKTINNLDKGMEGSMIDYLIKGGGDKTKIVNVYLNDRESEEANND